MKVKVSIVEQSEIEKEALQDEVNRRAKLLPPGQVAATPEALLESVVLEFVAPILAAWPQAKKDYIALMDAWTKMTLEQRRQLVANLAVG